MGFLHLNGDLLDDRIAEVFHGADADLSFEDDCHQAVLIHVQNEEAVAFALLVDTGEIGLIHQVCYPLRGSEGMASTAMISVLSGKANFSCN